MTDLISTKKIAGSDNQSYTVSVNGKVVYVDLSEHELPKILSSIKESLKKTGFLKKS